jgi:hypothetical protein
MLTLYNEGQWDKPVSQKCESVVTLSPASMDMSTEAEKYPLLEAATSND